MMQGWHTTYLGLKDLPHELSAFELQAFFTFARPEREAIELRRSAAHKLGLALHIGFLRLSGRMLSAVRIVPAALWNHLGKELGVASPELASLKAMYGHRSTLFEHQTVAQETLGQDCADTPEWHQSAGRLSVSGGEICRRFDAFAGTSDKCSGWLKPITV